MDVKIRECPLADREHTISRRQYAHTYHRANTICVARAYSRLPMEFKLGILFHELGHLLGAVDELEADRLAEKAFGVRIERVDSKHGEWLECLAAQNLDF